MGEYILHGCWNPDIGEGVITGHQESIGEIISVRQVSRFLVFVNIDYLPLIFPLVCDLKSSAVTKSYYIVSVSYYTPLHCMYSWILLECPEMPKIWHHCTQCIHKKAA